MPTIKQLPAVTEVKAEDEVLLSQDGLTKSASVGMLLSGTQPVVTVPSGSLLGRVSIGPGGPEPVIVGPGLNVSAGTLAATGTDHIGFPIRSTFSNSDEAILNSAGSPARLPLSALRALFSAGTNISIDANGVIASAGGSSIGPAGPAGANGANVWSGAGGPPASLGSQGDGFVNAATGDVYARGASGWSKIGNIAGPQGPSGPAGAQGSPGSAGPSGIAGPPGAQGPAGPVGPSGPAGSAGANGANVWSGTGVPSASLGFPSDGYVNAASGDVFLRSSSGWNKIGNIAGPQGPTGTPGQPGPIGPAGSPGPLGAQGLVGPAGPAGPQGPAGSSTSITNAAPATNIAAGDLVGISQGGTDHAITYASFLNGRLITDNANPSAVAMSDTDTVWVGQGGSSNLAVGNLLQAAAYLQGKSALWPKRRVEEPASTNLTFARHNRALVSFPNGGTLTVSSFSDCGDGFDCEVMNTSSVMLSLGAGITCFGNSTIQPKQVVSIRGVASNGVTAVYAQTPLAPGMSQSVSVGALANQLAAAPFPVAGTLTGYGAAPALSYSNDGGTTWLALPNGSSVTATLFSFTNPGLSARSSATVQVRDGNALTGSSNGFAVESGSFGTLPAFAAGQTSSVPFTLAGLSTVYLVWWNGAEIGSRTAASASPATVTAPTAGSYTLRLYDASSGGLLLAESASVTVASSAAGLTLPTVAASPVLYLDASNTGQSVGAITTVTDQSSAGNVISVSAGSPALAGAVQNGKAGISIPSGTVLSVSGPAIHAFEGMMAQATVFAVLTPRSFIPSSKSVFLSGAQNATIGNGGNADAGHIYFDYRSTGAQAQALPTSNSTSVATSVSAPTLGAPFIFVGQKSASSGTVQTLTAINSDALTPAASTCTGVASPFDRLEIGAMWSGSAYLYPCDMYILALAIYPAKLSAPDISAVKAALKSYWGTP
ncbi:MAG: collagen-like protein [Acetobacteraceae bacterium]|nr:collagen-like protein [Acetobacteraceae bacterium]